VPTPIADVAHLLRRAEFGGSATRIAALATRDLPDIVDELLALPGAPADVPPPILADASKQPWQHYQGWVLWWYDRMVTTPTPLQERMTLFWHGHFTTEQDKIYNGRLMYRQNALQRRLALGNFRQLCQQIAIDPAMLQYLDNDTNRVGRPQENWAREFWELFTLGVDQYTQDDIVAAARAWTGHTVTQKRSDGTGGDEYEFRASWHDNGNKTIFGTTRNWDGPEVIDHTLDHPQKRVTCAYFIAAKLWAYFAYPGADIPVLAPVANALLQSNWEIKPALRALFLSPEFYSERARSGLVRPPADFMVAAIRRTGLRVARSDLSNDPDAAHPEWYHEQMGQVLGNPPDVAGWKANAAWLNSGAFWARAAFARHITWQARKDVNGKLFEEFAAPGGTNTATIVQTALDRFGIDRVSPTTRAALERYVSGVPSRDRWAIPPNLITLCLLSPDFQLA
jgi:uncharacterized protein (DUF1800 family)